MSSRPFAAVALAVALGPGAPARLAAQARPPASETRVAELDRFVRQGMRDWRIPGLSLAVVQHDSVVLLRGYGVRRVDQPGAVDEQTLFGLMSTTKAFTAYGLALLVDEGRLGWEDPVTRWVPEFAMPDPWVTRELRVKDLLTHRAGLGNADLLWVRGDLPADEIFRRIRLLTPAYPFRDGFVYQNIMYGLAGRVIERVSGLGYGEFLRRRVFGPLGMTRTFASYAAMVALGDSDVSVPHVRSGDSVVVASETTVDNLPAAGALWSTASDMAIWVRFLLDSARVGGRRLLSDSSYRMLFAPQALIGPDEFYPTARLTRPHWTTYGFGWFQQDYRGHFVAFHTGSLTGRTAIVGLMPDADLGMYAFGNLDHAEFRHALMLKVFDLFGGGPEEDWNAELLALYAPRGGRPEPPRVTGTRPSLPLAAYAGEYRHPIWGSAVVRFEADTLWLAIGSAPGLAGPLEHWHFDTFQPRLGERRRRGDLVQFVLGPDGTVAALRLPGLGDFARVP